MKIAVGDSTDDVSHGIKIVALTLRWALGSDSEFIEFVKFLAKSTTNSNAKSFNTSVTHYDAASSTA